MRERIETMMVFSSRAKRCGGSGRTKRGKQKEWVGGWVGVGGGVGGGEGGLKAGGQRLTLRIHGQ